MRARSQGQTCSHAARGTSPAPSPQLPTATKPALPTTSPSKDHCWCPHQTHETFNALNRPSGETDQNPKHLALYGTLGALKLFISFAFLPREDSTESQECWALVQLQSWVCLVHILLLHWPLNQGWNQSLQQESVTAPWWGCLGLGHRAYLGRIFVFKDTVSCFFCPYSHFLLPEKIQRSACSA